MKIIEVYKKVNIYGKKVKKSQNKNKNSEWNFFKKNRGPDWIMDLLLKLWTYTLNFGIVWKKPEKISSEKLLQQISRHFLLSTFVVLWGVFQNFVFMIQHYWYGTLQRIGWFQIFQRLKVEVKWLTSVVE